MENTDFDDMPDPGDRRDDLSDEMYVSGPLKDYPQYLVKEFAEDLIFVFSIFEQLKDIYSQDSYSGTKKRMVQFKELLLKWKKKYRDIFVDFKGGRSESDLEINFLTDSNEIRTLSKKMGDFTRIVETKSSMKIYFLDDQNYYLTLLKRGELMTLVYSLEDIMNPGSPEFRLCVYFAMKGGFDTSIKLDEKDLSFSFGFNPIKDDWFKRYPEIHHFGRW